MCDMLELDKNNPLSFSTKKLIKHDETYEVSEEEKKQIQDELSTVMISNYDLIFSKEQKEEKQENHKFIRLSNQTIQQYLGKDVYFVGELYEEADTIDPKLLYYSAKGKYFILFHHPHYSISSTFPSQYTNIWKTIEYCLKHSSSQKDVIHQLIRFYVLNSHIFKDERFLPKYKSKYLFIENQNWSLDQLHQDWR